MSCMSVVLKCWAPGFWYLGGIQNTTVTPYLGTEIRTSSKWVEIQKSFHRTIWCAKKRWHGVQNVEGGLHGQRYINEVHDWWHVEKEYEKIGEKTQPEEVVEPQMDILSSSQASPKTFVWELHSLHKDSLSLVIFLLKMPLVLMGAPILSCMCLMPPNSLHRCC